MSAALQEAHRALLDERAVVADRLLAVDYALDAVARLLGNGTPTVEPASAPLVPEGQGSEVAQNTSDPAPAKPRAAKKAAKPKADGEHKCPECGRTFTVPQGLGRHRLSAHGVMGTSRAPKAPAAPSVGEVEPPAASPADVDHAAGLVRVPDLPPATIGDDALALRCDECPASFAVTERGKLVAHTIQAHRRDSRRDERIPRRASQVGA